MVSYLLLFKLKKRAQYKQKFKKYKNMQDLKSENGISSPSLSHPTPCPQPKPT